MCNLKRGEIVSDFISKNWLVSILLAVVGFFLMQTYIKLVELDKNMIETKLEVAKISSNIVNRDEIEKMVDNRIVIVLTNWSKK